MPNDAIRRIMAEVKEFSTLNSHPSSFFYAAPLESDLFEWHFSVRGPPDTPFAAGVYHGRILLPAEYPLKPPEIILLTPNGRFEVGKRICLSVTAHHQETWQPSWGIRTILTALVGFMPSKAEGVGALNYSDDHRRGLARKSLYFKCPRCGVRPVEQLPPREVSEGSESGASGGGELTKQGEISKAENNANGERKTETQLGISSGDVTDAGKSVRDESSAREAKEPTPDKERHAKSQEQQVVELKRNITAADTSATAANAAAPANVLDNDTDVITPQEAIPAQGAHQVDGTEPVRPCVSDTPAEVLSKQPREDVQEKELLYVAYAVVFLMLAIVVRRVINIVTL